MCLQDGVWSISEWGMLSSVRPEPLTSDSLEELEYWIVSSSPKFGTYHYPDS